MHLDRLRDLHHEIAARVGSVVVAQEENVRLLLVALLSRGHVLLEGVPGTGKTLLAKSFAASLSLVFKRIQFTPDLMPGDVIGTNLFDFQKNAFVLTRGPIFTEVLLADEINRTPPKTQAALLEAMQERNVTLDGQAHPLSDGFLVLAGSNGEGPGSTQLYFWDGGDCVPGVRTSGRVGRIELLGDLPAGAGGNAEGLALLDEAGAEYQILVVFDGVKNGGPTRFRVTKP